MKQKITIIIAVCAFILAFAVTLYPIISTHYNARHQSQIYTDYQTQLTQADNAALQTALQAAIAYNAAIQPGVQQGNAFSQDALRRAANDYDDLLNMGDRGIMGYVEIPKICVKLPIYHGTENVTLEKGVGHLLGSSLPVGGKSTHTVLTAHSGMASQKMFSDLDTITIGDVFYLDVLGDRLAYQVDQIKTVLPHDTTYLGIVNGEDYCTLVTCTPFGINSHRLLVRGTRIPFEKIDEITETSSSSVESASTWEQEYLKGICIAIGIVTATSIAIVSTRRIWMRPLKKIDKSENGGHMKNKKLSRILTMCVLLVFMVTMMSLTTLAAGTGNVSGAIENTWNAAQGQVKDIVNNVVFPVIDMILAILFFVKIATAYMEYRKHGQFDFTAPAILFACLLFSLTAPSYIWSIL